MMACTTCGKQLYVRNKSGYCAAHSNASPEKRAKISASLRLAMAANPELREARRRGGIASANLPGERERRAKLCAERRLWELGTAARTEETFAKIGRSTSERRMAWCPRELRDDARRLIRQNFKLADVKEIILAQHETNMARFRAKLGIQDNVIALRPVAPVNPEASLSEQILELIAWHFDTTPADITGSSRRSEHTRPRYAAAKALRLNGLSLAAIGKVLGGRDHSTISNALGQADALMAADKAFAAVVHLADELEALAA
jgi:hypothetical protein